jgi:hypothetical protein
VVDQFLLEGHWPWILQDVDHRVLFVTNNNNNNNKVVVVVAVEDWLWISIQEMNFEKDDLCLPSGVNDVL